MSTPLTIVIVGGVAGGMSTATRLRRNLEDAHIIVLERGQHVSFANCGLPYYAGGVIESRNSLLVQTPEALRARFNLDVRVRHEATHIDRERQQLHGTNLDTGEAFTLDYNYLVLAPGASPVRPPLPGIEHALTLRDVSDVDRITASIEQAPRNAVVLGGGFIGVELAENLTHRGIPTTIVQRGASLLAPFDPEMVAPLQQRLRDSGVSISLGRSATAVSGTSVTLDDGTEIPSDLTVAAVGVRPEDGLARDAGLDVHESGGILVDRQHRTSDPRIFAVGDAALKHDAISGSESFIPLAQACARASLRTSNWRMRRSSVPRKTRSISLA